MRRILVLALAVVTLIAVTAPAAFAQPTFKINGLIDTITSWSSNIAGGNYTNNADKEWYARNRARLNFTGEVGKAKGVVALEYDASWGQTGTADNAGTQKFGTTSGFDLNTDVRGVTELKWLYAEFPVPMAPVPMTMRIGAQPFSETYKLATLATGDFAGVNLVATLSPNVMWSFTYVAVEERLHLTGNPPPPAAPVSRGDDYAIITSLTVTPMKGVDIRPIYAFFHAEGTTSGSARPGTFNAPAFQARITTENRHTIGVDARWRSGPFSFDPTVLYQFGSIDFVPLAPGGPSSTDISAFLVDLLAGWRNGPLLLEVRGVYVSGNKAGDNLLTTDVNYYQPLDTDTSYMADGWTALLGLGLDYFNNGIGPLGMGSPISFDRYGRAQIGGKATYSVTPAFDVYALVSGVFTAEKVGPVVSVGGSAATGSRYVGVELMGGVDWRFAPGLSFGLQGAHLFAGDALRHFGPAGPSAKDVSTVAARVRFTF